MNIIGNQDWDNEHITTGFGISGTGERSSNIVVIHCFGARVHKAFQLSFSRDHHKTFLRVCCILNKSLDGRSSVMVHLRDYVFSKFSAHCLVPIRVILELRIFFPNSSIPELDLAHNSILFS